ncbi:hypothetical protein DAMA08_033000 [Martiniozyma asiatica (nom. inval.)]|nr:hypothetical protein DAMA08_033000 [Martiniozyma asiatica]
MVIYSMIISLGGFIFGYDIGTLGGIISSAAFRHCFGENFVNNEYQFSNISKGILISISCFGGCIGSIFNIYIIKFGGLKFAMFFFSITYAFGDLVILSAGNWITALLGRFLIGMACGGNCTVCPMYISVLAPSKHRGLFVSLMQLLTTVGIVIGSLSLYYSTSSYFILDKAVYQLPIIEGCSFACLSFSLIWLVPDSPQQNALTVRNSNSNSNSNSNANSDSDSDLSKDVNDMLPGEKGKIAHNQQHSNFQISTYFYYITTGIAVFGFQQFSGINYFFYYGTTIFSKIKLNSSYLVPVIFGIVNFAFSLISLISTSNYKRRSILLFGSGLMFVVMIIFSTVGLFAQDTFIGSMILIISSCIFISIFSVSWGPMAGVIISELYPLTIKVTAMSICGSMSWAFNFLISVLVPTISEYLGFGLGYIFAFFLFISIIFVLKMLPETKNLDSNSLDQLYKAKETEI